MKASYFILDDLLWLFNSASKKDSLVRKKGEGKTVKALTTRYIGDGMLPFCLGESKTNRLETSIPKEN